MAINLNFENSPDAAACDANGKPVAPIWGATESEYIRDSLKKVLSHQTKCRADAVECLKFYFNKDGAIDLEFLKNWLSKNQPLDRWFFVHLIEVAGRRFLDQSFSAHKAEIARSKNAAPRKFVLGEWTNRPDAGQSKAAFSRQFAPLVKRHFDLSVTPDVAADRKLTHLRPLCRSKTDPGVLLALPKFWAGNKQGDHYGNVGKNSSNVFARQVVVA